MAQSKAEKYAKDRKWAIKNREHVNQYAREWKRKNKERVNQLQRKRYNDNPEQARATSREWYHTHKGEVTEEEKAEQAAYMKKYHEENKETQSVKKQKAYQENKLNGHAFSSGTRRCGLTLDEYASLEEDQDWLCAICKSDVRLFLDHDHKTGKVRQFLCPRCNTALGFLESSPIPKFIDYLKKHGSLDIELWQQIKAKL